MATISRPLSDSELSYYLPSSEDGVSDMYLRLSVRIHPDIFSTQRMQLAWSILQIRNPMLAVRMESNFGKGFGDPVPGVSPAPGGGLMGGPKGYTPLQAKFIYDIPQTPSEALTRVQNHLELIPNPAVPIRTLLSTYLDGVRTISDSCVCKLLLVHAHPSDPEADFVPPTSAERKETNPHNPHVEPYIPAHLILFCAHFIGDAGSIQFISKDLMYLLSFPTAELERVLEEEVNGLKEAVRLSGGDGEGGEGTEFKGPATLLPASLEGRLPPIRGRFKNILSRMEFMKWQSRMIGGQSFPKKSNPTSQLAAAPTGLLTPPASTPTPSHSPSITPFHTSSSSTNATAPTQPQPLKRRAHTHTRTHELILSKERTADILARCKREGVTISTALFAVVGAAWAQLMRDLGEEESGSGGMPTLLYSARNMRPYLPPKAPRSVSGSTLKLTPSPGTAVEEGRELYPKYPGYKGWESYYYLSLSYFNVILPSWMPDASSSTSRDQPTALAQKTFWHRARLSRKQARGPNPESLTDLVRFISRTWQMGRARREGAEGFAVVALEKERAKRRAMAAAAAAATEGGKIASEGVGLGITVPTPVSAPAVPLPASSSAPPQPSEVQHSPPKTDSSQQSQEQTGRLQALRPQIPMRMPSQLAVPQVFPPSPPQTPGSGNSRVGTPMVEKTKSPLGSEIVPDASAAGEKAEKPEGAPAKAHTNPLAARFLPPKVPTTALLGLSLLGSFDPLFPPPNQSIKHLMPSTSPSSGTEADNMEVDGVQAKDPSTYDPSTYAPFEPISLGAGCRLKPSGSLLYAYTYDAQLTIVLGYDAGPSGLLCDLGEGGGVKRGIEGLWERIVEGIPVWLEEGTRTKREVMEGQKVTVSG